MARLILVAFAVAFVLTSCGGSESELPYREIKAAGKGGFKEYAEGLKQFPAHARNPEHILGTPVAWGLIHKSAPDAVCEMHLITPENQEIKILMRDRESDITLWLHEVSPQYGPRQSRYWKTVLTVRNTPINGKFYRCWEVRPVGRMRLIPSDERGARYENEVYDR